MRLVRRIARVHVIDIASEIPIRLRILQRGIHPVEEGEGRGRERGVDPRCRGGGRVVLEYPEGRAMRVGGGVEGYGVDGAVGAAVEIDDREPTRELALGEDVGEVAGEGCLG